MEKLSFLTVDEITSILKVNKMTIYRYIKRGQLKAYLFGKDYRINNADFEEFLNQALVRAEESSKKHTSCIKNVKKK